MFSRGTTKINLEDEDSLYIGMYRGCLLQVLVNRLTLFDNYAGSMKNKLDISRKIT